ncbi:MAG: hypothetical protein KF773_31780 [Deltaproteobacteria bacterium]|nr:hypothetical protein [Deltaproteobacteria bacterium]
MDLPPLPLDAWRDTRETLHRWAQVVGKVRLGLTPLINHWWNVPFYVSARGLTTSAITLGERWFEMEFDFVGDALRIQPNDGPPHLVELRPRSVADFYAATMTALRAANIDCHIWTMPVEMTDPIPFERDHEHRSYDKEYVLRFWDILAQADDAMTKFRGRFVGKCSPVQFYWGTFDLSVSRFSGRRAPPFEASSIEREAYSHEVASVGWWPGDKRLDRAAFYSYIAPEPPGFQETNAGPHAYYHAPIHCFCLDDDDVRRSRDQEGMVLDFFETTYGAAADLAGWPRAELEREPPTPPPSPLARPEVAQPLAP